MAPSPGKIHQLPVKVLYSIDTSPHSYVTVLSGLQDVYVHYSAPSYSSGQTHTGPLQGSCILKGVARAVCYASPECIPDNQCLDFSLYNLDPTERTPFPHAFNPAPDVTPSSWTGKGFMSWVLSESSPGTTLVRGKLVREYEFSSHHFHDMEGGLEALVAAANSTARKQDEADGKGWGLEVNVSLRQVNPEGKTEFKGRRAFEASLTKGGSDGQAPNSTNGMLSSPVAQRFPSQLQSGQSFAARPAGVGLGMAKTESKSPGSHKKPTNQASNGQAAGNAQSNRPSSAMGRPASSTGLPPSSFPGSSSSNLGQSRPSSSLSQNAPSRTAQSNFQPPRPPQPAASDAVFQPPAPPKPAQPRPVTPPPAPRSKSPPPSTPSRRHLQALLKADGNMSPDLARHLAANPMLRQILKAVPPGASLLSQLRSVKVDDLTGGQVQDLKREEEEKDRGSPAEPTTPTPSGPKTPLTQKPQSKQQPQNSQAAQQAKALQAAQGCCNCGTMVSSCWRVRKMKEGPPRKVCDDCGVYFNEHKQMRPQELWDPKPAPGGNATAGPGPSTSANASQSAEQKRRSQSHHTSSDLFSDGPAVRSSPRLRRRESQDHHTPTAANHYNTRSHPSEQALPPPTPRTAALMGSVAESPRKRYKGKAGQVADSPRMATRASARAGPSEFSSEVFGFALGDDGSAHSHSGHTPAARHHTGQSNPAALTPMLSNVSTTPIRLNHASSHSNPTDNTLPSVDESGNDLDPDFDINAFLSSMDNQTLGADDFDLNSLFTGQNGGEVNGELNLEIMELLANWDEDASGDGGDKGLPQSEGMDVDGSGL